MDKYKLVRIIGKDLEELKTLSEEIEATEEGSSLIIDLAISRARLLCQELELLKSYSAPEDSMKEETGSENPDEDEDEESDQIISEPELEILHFEEPDYTHSDELEEEEEETVVYDAEDEEEEEELEEETEDDFEEEQEPEEDDLNEKFNSDEEVVDDKDLEEDDFASVEEHELETDEDEEVRDFEDEEIEEEKPLKPVQQTIRQMKIDELDEEEEAVEFSPVSRPDNRQVMHEIPKPEEPVSEEEEEEEEEEADQPPVAETFQKERSLNSTLGESKAAETTISNSPITSLRAAIGLNDRFLFIKEIFNNNSEKYNTIIDQLDKMETIQQAVDYLKVNLSLQKNEISMKFVDLLKRRFTK
jgi:hypothetical protein